MFPVRLCLCIVLVATCSARPNWHKGFVKKKNIPQQKEVIIQHKRVHIETINSNEEGKVRQARQAGIPYFLNDEHAVEEITEFSNPQDGFSVSGIFGPPLEHQQPQGFDSIGKLTSKIQDIIKGHLEQTVQLNKEIHFSLVNNFAHLPGSPPSSPLCSNCPTHDTHHATPSGSQNHHFQSNCPDGNECRDIPIHIDSSPVNPPRLKPGKEIPKTQSSTMRTSTTTDQQEVVDGNSKTTDSKEIPDIDIRYG